MIPVLPPAWLCGWWWDWDCWVVFVLASVELGRGRVAVRISAAVCGTNFSTGFTGWMMPDEAEDSSAEDDGDDTGFVSHVHVHVPLPLPPLPSLHSTTVKNTTYGANKLEDCSNCSSSNRQQSSLTMEFRCVCMYLLIITQTRPLPVCEGVKIRKSQIDPIKPILCFCLALARVQLIVRSTASSRSAGHLCSYGGRNAWQSEKCLNQSSTMTITESWILSAIH